MGCAGLELGAEELGVVVVSGFLSLLHPAAAAATTAADPVSTATFRAKRMDEFISASQMTDGQVTDSIPFGSFPTSGWPPLFRRPRSACAVAPGRLLHFGSGAGKMQSWLR